jgi:hypothetical protein
MVPNSNNLVGEATELHQHLTGPYRHKVTGTVETDGTVAISDPVVGLRGTYREQGGKGYLAIRFPIDPENEPDMFVGPATGRKVDVKWHTYSWSSEMLSQIVSEGNSNYVVAGKIEIGEVSDLRLLTETQASANVTWTGVLNRMGMGLHRGSPPSGRWRVLFGKKPDGTWFVDRLH